MSVGVVGLGNLGTAEKIHVPVPLAKGLWDVINGRYSSSPISSANSAAAHS
jgi:hypothetical protein